MLLGLAVRVNNLGRLGLCTDEGHSAWMASQPLTDLPRLLAADSAPPLYYALLHVWQGFFPSDAGLRALSLIFGVAAVPLLYLAGRRMMGEGAGIAAAFFMAVSNFHVEYSQIAKFYTLFFLFAALALLALLRACERPESRLRWALYGVLISGVMWTHAVGPFIVAGLSAFGAVRLGSRLRPHLLSFAGAHLLALVLFAPWLGVALPQANAVVHHFWAAVPRPATLLQTLDAFLLSPPWIPLALRDTVPDAKPGLAALPLGALMTADGARSLWLAIPRAALLLAMIVVAVDRKLRSALALVLLVIVPMAGLFVISRLVGSIYLHRVQMPTMAAIILLLSAPFAAAASEGRAAAWLRRGARAASLSALLVMAVAAWHVTEARSAPAWREAAAWVTSGAGAGDAIVYDAHFGQIIMERYLDAEASRLSAYGLPSDWYDGKTPTNGKWVTSEEDLARLKEAAEDHGVIWFVRSHTYVHDRQELGRTWCDANLQRTDARRFPFIEVIRYETMAFRPAGAAGAAAEGQGV